MQDGPASVAKFYGPAGVAVMPDSSACIVADFWNNCLRLINLNSFEVSTLAVTSGVLQKPYGVAIMLNPAAAVVSVEGDHRLKAINLATMAVDGIVGLTSSALLFTS